jgi:hypothetical protein
MREADLPFDSGDDNKNMQRQKKKGKAKGRVHSGWIAMDFSPLSIRPLSIFGH